MTGPGNWSERSVNEDIKISIVAGAVVQVKNDGVNKSILLIGKSEQKGGRKKQQYQEPEFRFFRARSWGCGTQCCHDLQHFHQVSRFVFSSLA
jgi:hypothetical protein